MEHEYVISVRGKVKKCTGRWPRVQKIAGVSRSWLYQFSRGDITNPTINKLQAVSDACDAVFADKLVTARGRSMATEQSTVDDTAPVRLDMLTERVMLEHGCSLEVAEARVRVAAFALGFDLQEVLHL
jgi:hypothetical protein